MENIQYERKTIDGFEVIVQPFPATKALKLLTRLINQVGGAVGATLSGVEGELSLNATLNKELIGSVIDALSSKINEGTVELIKELMDGVHINNEKQNFDLFFTRRYGLLFKILRYVLEVNYGDFLSSMKTVASGFEAKAEAPQR